MGRIHGQTPREPKRIPLSPINEGRYGRMFRRLGQAPMLDDAQLTALAESMRESGPDAPPPGGWNSGTPQPTGGDNEAIPAVYTYFGQFVDHDVTFDPTSSFERKNDPDALHNFRTPRLDLDSLYGSGPADEPFQYAKDNPGRMLIGSGPGGEDLPRNEEGVALIGDPRNDENTIVSQLQLAFLKLHNRIAADIAGDTTVADRLKFAETQRRVRWHYQYVVVNDFLVRLCGQELINSLLDLDDDGEPQWRLRYYRPKTNPFMPVEFSAAAYRFGHSQVRASYDLNQAVQGIPVFRPRDKNVGPLDDLRGGKPLPDQWTIDWSRFTNLGESTPQLSRLIDTKISKPLFDLPRLPAHDPQSLPFLNLKRGQALELPSGQDVARFLKGPVLSSDQLGGAPEPTPLWFYLLKEAEVLENGGQKLGPAGARIIAEVLLGLLRNDPASYLNQQPNWTPSVPLCDGPQKHALVDLYAFAGGQ